MGVSVEVIVAALRVRGVIGHRRIVSAFLCHCFSHCVTASLLHCFTASLRHC